MEPRKAAQDMTGDELRALIGSLTDDELREMLTYLAGYAPAGFDWALGRVRPS